MSAPFTSAQSLEQMLLSTIKDFVNVKAKEIYERKTLEAQKELEKAVQEQVATVALTVSSMATFQNLGHKIVIEIANNRERQ